MDKDNHKLTIQSNEITLSKINVNSVYQKRVLYAIVDSVSPYLRDKLNTSLNEEGLELNYEKGMFEVDRITYRLKDIEPNHQNYSLLKKGLNDLLSQSINIETDENIIGTSLVLKYIWNKRDEHIEITIDRDLYNFLTTLSKGYTLFQLKTAMSLPSVYSMKIYELIAKWRGKPKFFIEIDKLRFLTNTLEKYKKTNDLIKRVLETSKEHLNQSTTTDLRFDYEPVKSGRSIIGFNIFVIKTENSFEFNKEVNSTSPSWDLPRSIITVCKELEITLKGKSFQYFKDFYILKEKNETAVIEQIRYWESMARKGEKLIAGYIIKSIKRELGEK
ncbi:MAG: replication initiation protein [Saprospiraceae bacterium]